MRLLPERTNHPPTGSPVTITILSLLSGALPSLAEPHDHRRKAMAANRAWRLPRHLLAVAFLSLVSTSALAQQPVAYPGQGQDAAQQASDEAECYGWAKQSTGLDPALISQAPQAQAAPPPSGPAVGGGQRMAGALRGAAGGAIIGEIVDDDAGEGAAIGAVAGTMAGGRRARQQQQVQQQQQQQQQQTQSQQQQQMDTFNRAYAACMEGRGYTIR